MYAMRVTAADVRVNKSKRKLTMENREENKKKTHIQFSLDRARFLSFWRVC